MPSLTAEQAVKMLKKAKLALLAMQRNPWEQGVAIQAFLELGEYDTVFALAKEAAYRAMPDGRPAMISVMNSVTDPCSTGEGLIYAAAHTQDPEIKSACDNLLIWALEKAPRNSGGILYHISDKPQFWSDSMYMLPPYLAASGHYDEALRQLNGYWNALYSNEHHLMRHIWDDGKKEFARSDFWGVGNGWTVAALARLIDLLPENMRAERQDLTAKAHALIDSLITYMRPDGFFHDIVDDSGSFVETNLSQMVCYSVFRAKSSNWAKSEWLPAAEKMRAAALSKVDRYGLVRDVCGAPTFDKPGVAPEGQAFFLMMEAAFAKANE